MCKKKEIEEKDLDFHLTIIAMFCEYNISLHYSDKMFADITADIGKTIEVILRLANDGYITAKHSKNFSHRYEIDITPKGVDFQKHGGYKKEKTTKLKRKIGLTSKNFLMYVFSAIIGGAITKIIDVLF